jgi:hypothetical protein
MGESIDKRMNSSLLPRKVTTLASTFNTLTDPICSQSDPNLKFIKIQKNSFDVLENLHAKRERNAVRKDKVVILER